jgi:hypothetical protein
MASGSVTFFPGAGRQTDYQTLLKYEGTEQMSKRLVGSDRKLGLPANKACAPVFLPKVNESEWRGII